MWKHWPWYLSLGTPWKFGLKRFWLLKAPSKREKSCNNKCSKYRRRSRTDVSELPLEPYPWHGASCHALPILFLTLLKGPLARKCSLTWQDPCMTLGKRFETANQNSSDIKNQTSDTSKCKSLITWLDSPQCTGDKGLFLISSSPTYSVSLSFY